MAEGKSKGREEKKPERPSFYLGALGYSLVALRNAGDVARYVAASQLGAGQYFARGASVNHSAKESGLYQLVIRGAGSYLAKVLDNQKKLSEYQAKMQAYQTAKTQAEAAKTSFSETEPEKPKLTQPSPQDEAAFRLLQSGHQIDAQNFDLELGEHKLEPLLGMVDRILPKGLTETVGKNRDKVIKDLQDDSKAKQVALIAAELYVNKDLAGKVELQLAQDSLEALVEEGS